MSGPGDPEWERRQAIVMGEAPKPEPDGEVGGPQLEEPQAANTVPDDDEAPAAEE